MKEEKFTIRTLTESKEIGRALANDTAREVLEVLSKDSLSAAQISQKLGKPLTTVDYALRMLLKSKLIKTEKYAWGQKGRISKLYSLQEKYIIITPRKEESTADVLKKFISLVFVIVTVSVFLGLSYTKLISSTLQGAPQIATEIGKEVPSAVSKPTAVKNLHYGLVFFILSFSILILYALAKRRIFSLRKFS